MNRGSKWIGVVAGYGLGLMSGYMLFHHASPQTPVVPTDDSEYKATHVQKEPSTPSAPAAVTVKPLAGSSVTPPPAIAPKAAEATPPKEPVIAEIRKLVQQGNQEEALALLEKALKEQPDNQELQIEMASFQSRVLGKDSKALQQLERVLSKDPSSRGALDELLNIATVPNEKRAGQEGASLLKRMSDQNPQSSVAQAAMGEYLARSGKIQQAAAQFERAANLPGATDDIKFRAADMYYQTGRPEKATQVFVKNLQESERRFRENPSNEAYQRKYQNDRLDVIAGRWRQGDPAARDMVHSFLNEYPDHPLGERLKQDIESNPRGGMPVPVQPAPTGPATDK